MNIALPQTKEEQPLRFPFSPPLGPVKLSETFGSNKQIQNTRDNSPSGKTGLPHEFSYTKDFLFEAKNIKKRHKRCAR